MSRKVKLMCITNQKFPDIVYGQVVDADTDEVLIDSLLEYCVVTSIQRQFEIVNLLEVVYWMMINIDFNVTSSPMSMEQVTSEIAEFKAGQKLFDHN